MRIKDILESIVDEGVNDPHIFKVVFLAGGPGSGKSFVSDKLMKHNGLKVVNSDDIYEYLMTRAGLGMEPEDVYSDKGQEIRNTKAKPLTKKMRGNYIEGRLGLIIDGTGKDVEKVRKENEELKALGYDTMMLFVNTSHDIAQERNLMRPRKLPKEEVSRMWQKVQDNIMKFQQVFGAQNFVVLDNSGGLEDPTRAKEFDNVWKHIDKFVNTPPRNPKAREWIRNQRSKR